MVVRLHALAAERRQERREARTALRLVAEEEWLTADEVAAELGCHVNTVYRMRAAGQLPARLHGTRVYRYSREAVEAFKHGQTNPDNALTTPSQLDRRTFAQLVREWADFLEGRA